MCSLLMTSFRGAQTVDLSTARARLTKPTSKYNYKKEIETARTRELLEPYGAKKTEAAVRGALEYMIWLIARTASGLFREHVDDESEKKRTLWVSVNWRFEQKSKMSEEDNLVSFHGSIFFTLLLEFSRASKVVATRGKWRDLDGT